VEEEPVGSRWEGSQQVWIEGVEGNLLSFSFVLSTDQYRLSLEGVCADIGLRQLPDHSQQSTVSTQLIPITLPSYHSLYLAACIVVVLFEHLFPVTAGSVIVLVCGCEPRL
jgi:hypothetical protein